MEGGDFTSTTLRTIMAAYHGIEVGLYSYGGCFEPKRIPAGTSIGRYGSFSEFRVFSRNHPLDFVSLHPYFYNTRLGYVQNEFVSHTRLKIGHGVWVGYRSVILSGVSTIGDGAVIGAGSIVTRDVPPYAIVAGNPARVVRYRFSESIVAEIEKTRWWEKGIQELAYSLDIFTTPVSLIDWKNIHISDRLDTNGNKRD